MTKWHVDIEKEKDSKDQVKELGWVLHTNNGINGYIAFYSKCNIEVRRLNKLVPGRAKAVSYHSASNKEAIKQHINNQVNSEMANLTTVVEAAMDVNTFDNGVTTYQTSSNKTAANVADNLTYYFSSASRLEDKSTK